MTNILVVIVIFPGIGIKLYTVTKASGCYPQLVTEFDWFILDVLFATMTSVIRYHRFINTDIFLRNKIFQTTFIRHSEQWIHFGKFITWVKVIVVS